MTRAAADEEKSKAASRLIAFWVPDWPITALLREGLAHGDDPVAIHDGRTITVTSAQARVAGVRRGMTRRSAQAICPGLALFGMDEGRDVRAFEPVLRELEEVVPHPAPMRPGVALMPAYGAVRYLGSEYKVAEELTGAGARAAVEGHVGIADGLLAAMLASRSQEIVTAGASARFLAPRDVRELVHATSTRNFRIEMREFAEVLVRLGLLSLGEFAALPLSRVASRFGALGQHAWQLAAGVDAPRAYPARIEPDLDVSADLDPPAAQLDRATAAMISLAEELHHQLLRRSAACGLLRVCARTEDGQELERTWRIEGALTASELSDRARWQLEGWLSGRSGRPPCAPLTHLSLTAEEISPADSLQDGLWGRRRRGQKQAGDTALRMQGILGADRVLVPLVEGGRGVRERIRLVAWGDELKPIRDPQAPWPGKIPPPLPSRVLAKPEQVDLFDRAGRPVAVTVRGSLTAEPVSLRVRGEPVAGGKGTFGRAEAVSEWAGPWPNNDRWWDGKAPRFYLQVIGEDTAALLYIERSPESVPLATGVWRIEGIYE